MDNMNKEQFRYEKNEEKVENQEKSKIEMNNEPELQLRIFAITNILYNIYFDKEEKLNKYIKNNKGYGEKIIIDYLGHMSGRADVIKITYSDNSVKYFSEENDLGYMVYNQEKSISSGQDVWEYEYGDLKDIYNELKKRGIKLENDVYGRIDELFASVSDSFIEPLKRR